MDVNQLAKSVVEQATGGTAQAAPAEDLMRQVMREMGRRGGLKGGKARSKSLSAERKSQIAKNAAIKRWGK
jgi:hypothetical protein